MTVEEYFGDWIDVINRRELSKIIRWLSTVDDNFLCPSKRNIFKAFTSCPYKQCNVVCLGQDPYPQPGVATGILFGNRAETPEHLLSPSLKVVKRAVGASDAFDNTMESWSKQGILMINTALTCIQNRIGSHVNMWRPFISSLVESISINRPDMIFLFIWVTMQNLFSLTSTAILSLVKIILLTMPDLVLICQRLHLIW